MPLLPLLVPIEVLSYLIRPVSLSVRLFANMMAGHTMLKVFGGFVVMLGILGGWAPLAFIVALTGLEVGIACPAGLRLHHPDLHLSQRCGPHASLKPTSDPNEKD